MFGIGEPAMAVVAAFLALHPTPAVTVEDLACASQNAWFEARGGGPEDWSAITKVVKNRVTHPKFPSTVCDVIWEQRQVRGKLCPQFEWTLDGRPDLIVLNKWTDNLFGHIVEIVYNALVEDEDETDGAIYFWMPHVTQNWSGSLRPVGSHGMHIFFGE
jgi:spore germination cell wall hydrolase CwlJ-like protein